MIEEIIEYLVQNGGKADSKEIVKNVLKMPEVNSGISDMLVKSIVKDSDKITFSNHHCELNAIQTSIQVHQSRIFLVKIVPERTLSFHEFSSVRIAEFGGNKPKVYTFFEKGPHDYVALELLSICKDIDHLIDNSILVFDGFGNQITSLRRILQQVLGRTPNFSVLSLKRLVQKLYPNEKINNSESISAVMGVVHLWDALPEQMMELFLNQFTFAYEACVELGYDSIEKIMDFVVPENPDLNFTNYEFDKDTLESMPELPGIYLMKDKDGQIIYVGKSKNLYDRVNSYFRKDELKDFKILEIRQRIHSINTIVTGNELEALLIEYENIQKYNPDINKQIDIHERRVPTEKLKAQIVFLQHFQKEMIKLCCVIPDVGILLLDLKIDGSNIVDIVEKINNFSKSKPEKNDKRIDIVASWLYNNETVNVLYLDDINPFKDLERLIGDYIKSIVIGEKRIIQI